MQLPKPMQVVTLFRVQEEEREVLYRVRVQDVTTGQLVLDVPLAAKGSPVAFAAGEVLRIGYVIEHRAFFTFATEVVEVTEGDVPQLVVACPKLDQIRKVQRRNFFRVPVLVYGVLYPTQGKGVMVQICDLSGGGFSFRASQALLVLGQEVRGAVQLPRVGEVNFEAVVRRLEVEVGGRSSCLHGLEFKHFTEAGRNKIVRYCFERQAKLLKFSPP